MLERFLTVCNCMHAAFVSDQLPQPGYLGATRLGRIDISRPRVRAALSAALVLAAYRPGSPLPASPRRFTPSPATPTTPRRAADDIRNCAPRT
jgi:hypothetical protein